MKDSIIVNARDIPLCETARSFADVKDSILAFSQPAIAVFINKEQVSGYTEERQSEVATRACIQPFNSQQLKILSEGQRAWRWFTLWCLDNLNLMPDDAFIIKGVRYRIQERLDWSDYGYTRYNVIEDYTDNASR